MKESYAEAWLAEADALEKLGKIKAAIDLLNQYLKVRPEDNRASVMIANLSKKH